ncbi:ArsR family transcriptional regulator [Candidatus Lucifugimonas marina]|uniref:ArsR family transcriptional regulator n=1 Tax=Candidatus Lucifugimonas marina TaxID=3038979 RepID=UPI0027A66703|nr:ArsR family transcriptional regulator [SAR202 cluster bacterium JH545]
MTTGNNFNTSDNEDDGKRQSSGSLARVHKAMRLLLKDPDIEALEIAMATVQANRMSADAVAAFLVGPPSSGKTEIIMACSGIPSTHWLSTITSKTLASGLSTTATKGAETALLLQLKEDGITTLLLKEFGSVLSMRSSDRTELISQLREVLDGQYRKQHGSGREVNWTGVLGMVAGVTGELEKYWGTVRKIGDRWIWIRPRTPKTSEDRLLIAREAIDTTGDGDRKREALKRAVTEHTQKLSGVRHGKVECSDKRKEQIALAAEYLAVLRTPVDRDNYSKQVVSVPESEIPARLAKGLYNLVLGIVLIRDRAGKSRVTDQDVKTIFRVVRDSIPSLRRVIIEQLINGTSTVKEISKNTELSESTIGRSIEELRMLGFVTVDAGYTGLTGMEGRHPDLWSLTDRALSPPGIWNQ